MSVYPKVTFGIIVLNGEPFTKYCLRSLYRFAHEIIVVEGASQGASCISTPDGHSRDDTLESLHKFKEREDPENKLKIVTRDGFWSEKDEQSQAYAEMTTGDYLWQVDIDEFYMPEDMDYILKMLKSIPEISGVSFKQITFWGDVCYRCDSTFPLLNGSEPVYRIFKFGEGYRYTNHRPPTVVDHNGVDLRSKKYVDAGITASKGIYLYHYSLLLPKQVQEKVTYYRNLPYEQCRSMPQWAQDNYHRISNPYNVFNVHTYPGWLERYNGKHPPQIHNMMNDIKAKKLNVETRCNVDVEEFIDNPKYRSGINLIKEEYKRRVDKTIKMTDPILGNEVFREFLEEYALKGAHSGGPEVRCSKHNRAANRKQKQLSIVHINTHDVAGGASKVAWRLAAAQRDAGYDSKMLVGIKVSDSRHSLSFPIESDKSLQGWCRRNGQLDYEFQGSHKLVDNPLVRSADILHLHNLHGGYFHPFSLALISNLKPTVWTLHDMQSITGHCAHSFDCQRWKNGCGQCPGLSIYPDILVDTSAQLSRDKKQIYDISHLNIVTPSQWLKDQVEQSILRNHPVELIYNGVDTDIFKPYDRKEARKKFGIPADVLVIGAVAHFGVLQNPWKGGNYTQAVVGASRIKLPAHVFVNIGSNSETNDPRIINIPHINNETELAWAYSALDVFLYTPVADNCPLVVLEALSCGVPIVTFNTGGVPELVRDGLDGYVTAYKDVREMTQVLEKLASQPQLLAEFSRNARQSAVSRFNHKMVAGQYQNLYERCLEENQLGPERVKSLLNSVGKDVALNFGLPLEYLGEKEQSTEVCRAYLQNNAKDEQTENKLSELESNKVKSHEKDDNVLSGKGKLTVATSIAPNKIDRQVKAIDSWVKLGLDVVSINCREEIEILQGSFPDVKFIQAKRDARNTYGKSFIYFDEFLKYFQESDCEFCGIVNSDIHLFADEGIVSFIRSQTKDSLVYGHRIEVDSLEDLRGQVCETGFDFFFFDSSLISCFPKSDFCIGKPWWDYWLPTIAVLEGFSAKQLISPFAYHIKHLCKWDTEEWGALAKKFFGYLQDRIEVSFYSDPRSDPWALLGKMFSVHHHQYLQEKGIEDKNKMSMGIIVPCILEFLEKKTVQITYANNTSADSQSALRPSKEKKEVAQHKEVIQQKETAQNVERQMDFEAQRNSQLTIATSIAPKDLKKQAKAIESWTKLGFDVVSLNCGEEINILQGSFPNVKFIQAKRDARNTFGKPVIYLDDFFEYFCQADSELCGIVNSDVFLIGDEGIIPFIQSQARNALVYGSRMEIDSLEVLRGEVYEDGFDFFFFHKSLISCFPKSDFCIGIPWWDYWVPLISALEKVQIKKFITPFAYHIKHSFNWDMGQWIFLAKKCLKYLLGGINENFNENPDNNPWAFLGNIFSTYHNQDAGGSGTKYKMSPDILCQGILEFLEKKTLQITYADNKSTDSRNVPAPAKKKEDIFIHKSDSRTPKSDYLSAEYDVSIVICTRDRAGLLDEMLTSLKEAARGVVYELIVVEGGSRDNTLDVLRKHNVIKVYSESEWLGQGRHSWPQLYNFGFSMTSVKWAMYASDDIVFAKGCVSKALRLLNKQRDEVAGGIFFYKNAYQTRPEWDKFGIDFTYGPRLLMNYGLVRLDHFREVGGLDEAYRFYCADSDLCCKLYEKGKQLIPLPESFVAHNNVLDVQKQANADTSSYDIELFLERWKHLVPTEIPRPRRLFWQEKFFDAFNLPADLERIDSGIESFWYGLACFQEGLFEEAKSRFMQVVKSFCDHEQVLWYLARAADKCGDKAMAEKAATAVVKLAPDFEPGLDFLVHLGRQGQRVAVPAVCSVKSGSVSTVDSYAVATGIGELREEGAVCSEVTGNLRRANRGFAALKRTQNKTDRNRYEMDLRRKIKKFNKVVIWGLKTQKHTHAYIHHHFYSTLEKLDASVVLVDDRVEDEGIIGSGDLVISVDVSSSNLPIKEGVYYCLHNCSDDIHRKIEPSRSIRLQKYTNSAEQADQRWGLVTFFDSKTRTLFQPWATDLLGNEFEEPILEKSSNIVFWVGSIWNDGLGRGNNNEIEILKDVLEERDIRFIHLHDISDSLHVKYIRHSLIAPAIAGRWQVENDYLACRMWKNISYGQLGVSNVRKFDDVFNGCTVKGESIEEIIDNTLSLPFDRYRDMIYEQQEIVREHHTYVNRLLNIIKAFEFVESL